MLDLRKPAGYFFLLLGLVLLATGLLAPDFSAPLLATNLNRTMGLFMIAFGGVFLWLAKRA